jgi:hypothetical protein
MTKHLSFLIRPPVLYSGDKMRLSDLRRGLECLADRMGLVGDVTYGRPGSQIAVIESCAHEIAHRLLTGPQFEILLQRLPSAASNRHEASALRVEVAALGLLGCKVSLRTLWERANWRGDSFDEIVRGALRPLWITMTRELTAREDRCVRWLLMMVERVHYYGDGGGAPNEGR